MQRGYSGWAFLRFTVTLMDFSGAFLFQSELLNFHLDTNRRFGLCAEIPGIWGSIPLAFLCLIYSADCFVDFSVDALVMLFSV